MAMLAEPKRKQKVINLRAKNNAWSNDHNKFGQRMLEKMGWSAGKGLGANENGIVEHVVARYKNDDKGLGYEDKNDQWTKHEDDFNSLLANLSNDGDNKQKLHSGVSLEIKSKKSKARVHYHKFTRAKDLSRYSEKDLANIFGKKSLKTEATIETGKDELKTTEQIFTVKGSMEDYFKNKLKNIESKSKLCVKEGNDNNSKEYDGDDYVFSGFSMSNDETDSADLVYQTSSSELTSDVPVPFSFYSMPDDNNSGSITLKDIKKTKNNINPLKHGEINESKCLIRKKKKRKHEKNISNLEEQDQEISSLKVTVSNDSLESDKKNIEEINDYQDNHKQNKKNKSKMKECAELEITNEVDIEPSMKKKKSKRETMVVHDVNESATECALKSNNPETKKYLIVQNHIRELSEPTNNKNLVMVNSDLEETGSQKSNPETKKVKRKSSNTNTVHKTSLCSDSKNVQYISKSDIEELRTVYNKCKSVISRIEHKYGNLLDLVSSSKQSDSIMCKNNTDNSRTDHKSHSEDECTCILNKKILFSDDGSEITTESPVECHICPKKLKRRFSDVENEKNNISVEFEECDITIPDDLQSLKVILRSKSVDIGYRNKVLQKLNEIKQGYLMEVKFNKPSLMEQAKAEPNKLFIFKGANLSTLPGYLLYKC